MLIFKIPWGGNCCWRLQVCFFILCGSRCELVTMIILSLQPEFSPETALRISLMNKVQLSLPHSQSFPKKTTDFFFGHYICFWREQPLNSRCGLKNQWPWTKHSQSSYGYENNTWNKTWIPILKLEMAFLFILLNVKLARIYFNLK